MIKRRTSKPRRSGTGKRGCLCPDEDIYHPDCCKPDNRWGQGPGQIYADISPES